MPEPIKTVDPAKMDEVIIDHLNKGLDRVTGHVDEQIKTLEKSLGDISTEMDNQAKTRGEVETSLKEKYSEIEKAITSMKDRQDAFEKASGRLNGHKGESFNSAMYKAIKENAEKLKGYASNNRVPVGFDLKELTPSDMSRKDAITMTEGDSLTGEVIEPTRVPGVKFDPERRFRVRQVIPQGTTNSNAIAYVEENYDEDGVNVVAEGAAKPQSSLKLERKTSNVTKIATYFKISEEMLEDVAGLSSHISLRGTQKYFNKEDQQLLYGTGANNQLEGLTVSATDYTNDAFTDTQAQEYDILLQSVKQLLDNNYQATASLISIKRYFDMIQRKDTDGRYIMPEAVIFGAQRPMVQGVPIIATNALSDDDFLVADFPMLTTLFDRRGISVRFFDQNEDDAIKNLVTVVIEGRLALPTYLPGAGRFGNFANAIQNAGNS